VRRPLYVEGRLQTRKFQDRQGLTREVTEIVAGDLQFLDRSGEPRSESGEVDEDAAMEPAGEA